MSAAAEVLLTGRMFDGYEAKELGLCSRVLPNHDVLPAALETRATSPPTPHRYPLRTASGCCGIRGGSRPPRSRLARRRTTTG
jgi:enoyl-CoA hydratase/carnithine racemase